MRTPPFSARTPTLLIAALLVTFSAQSNADFDSVANEQSRSAIRDNLRGMSDSPAVRDREKAATEKVIGDYPKLFGADVDQLVDWAFKEVESEEQ